jgi:capsule polysaccharide export protein KpsE/RkpR
VARAKNAAEKVERDRQIVAAKARSLSDATVADTFNVDESTVREVMAQWRESQPNLKTIDPIEVVEQVLFELRGSIEELALVSSTTKNDNVRVGAIKARIDALDKMTSLMQATGVLPNDLGTLKVDMDVRAFAATVLRVFTEEQVPEETVEKVMTAISQFAGN